MAWGAAKADYAEILTEVSIDSYNFQVTWNPFESGSCILWFRDARTQLAFTALGKFSKFDKRRTLGFMVKYATSDGLRLEIEHRRFERKLQTVPLSYFHKMELARYTDRERAYRSLFDLDAASAFELATLSRRRKMMTKKFHPDLGGDHKAMSLINEAYDYLSRQVAEGA